MPALHAEVLGTSPVADGRMRPDHAAGGRNGEQHRGSTSARVAVPADKSVHLVTEMILKVETPPGDACDQQPPAEPSEMVAMIADALMGG